MEDDEETSSSVETATEDEEIPAWADRLAARIDAAVNQQVSSFETRMMEKLSQLSIPTLPPTVEPTPQPEPEAPMEEQQTISTEDMASNLTEARASDAPTEAVRKKRANYRLI